MELPSLIPQICSKFNMFSLHQFIHKNTNKSTILEQMTIPIIIPMFYLHLNLNLTFQYRIDTQQPTTYLQIMNIFIQDTIVILLLIKIDTFQALTYITCTQIQGYKL